MLGREWEQNARSPNRTFRGRFENPIFYDSRVPRLALLSLRILLCVPCLHCGNSLPTPSVCWVISNFNDFQNVRFGARARNPAPSTPTQKRDWFFHVEVLKKSVNTDFAQWLPWLILDDSAPRGVRWFFKFPPVTLYFSKSIRVKKSHVYPVFFRLISVNIIVSECQNPLDFKKSYVHTVFLRLNSFGTLFVNWFYI